jgi:hypothetical protein
LFLDFGEVFCVIIIAKDSGFFILTLRAKFIYN